MVKFVDANEIFMFACDDAWLSRDRFLGAYLMPVRP